MLFLNRSASSENRLTSFRFENKIDEFNHKILHIERYLSSVFRRPSPRSAELISDALQQHLESLKISYY